MHKLYRWLYLVMLISPLFVFYLFPFPFSALSLEDEVPPQFRQFILRYDPDSLSIASQFTQELVKKEDERFRHIDTKATTLLGMLAVAITVIASIGALVIREDCIKSSAKYFLSTICVLWVGTFIFLLLSFAFALEGTRVIVDPSVGGYHGIPPKALLGPDRVSQDKVSFQKSLLTEMWEVILKNNKENARKALSLLRAQTMVFYGSVLLCWLILLFSSAFVFGPPPEAHVLLPTQGLLTKIKGALSCLSRSKV